jgi:hypothetical protein
MNELNVNLQHSILTLVGNGWSNRRIARELDIITRGKKLVVLIGQRKALGMAVKNNRTQNRFSGLLERLITTQSS